MIRVVLELDANGRTAEEIQAGVARMFETKPQPEEASRFNHLPMPVLKRIETYDVTNIYNSVIGETINLKEQYSYSFVIGKTIINQKEQS